MDREMEAYESAEEPLLSEEEKNEEDLRVPWEPSRTEYLGTKVKYFRRLQKDWVAVSPPIKPVKDQNIYPPTHILPPTAFLRGSSDEQDLLRASKKQIPYQSSLATIFSIWNTMIGSTLVALPYGFSCSGVLLGIGIVILVGVICCYTCNLVVYYGKDFTDFGDLTQYHFGKRAQIIALSVSLFVLLGACIAYHVLMKQCAYNIFLAIFQWLDIHVTWTPSIAALLICILFPLTNLREFSTLVFLNSFGVPFLLFTIYFITFHGIQAIASHKPLDHIDFGAKDSFGVLGGIVTLSFFIHNAIQPIIRNSNPATYSRDVTSAYFLVGVSYTVVGVLGYIGFPQGSIQQNFLDAFPVKDAFTFAARLSLLLQLSTVFPLFFLIIRTQLFGLLYHTPWPGTWSVFMLNVGIMTTTTLFAIYYPNVGDILRFTGAFGGLVLIFIVPIAIHLKQSRAKNRLTMLSLGFHGGLILLGVILLLFLSLHDVYMAAIPRLPTPSTEDQKHVADNALDALPCEAKDQSIKSMHLLKQGDYYGAIAALEIAIEIEGDSWILWKHLALVRFELWKHVASARATLASTMFLTRHIGAAADPLELFLRNAYDTFIVAMEYHQNKHNPSMLLKLSVLYVELDAFQGALALCTLILESTRMSSFGQYHESIFQAAVVATGLNHPSQSGEYFAYLVDIPPFKMHSYRLLVLAGMQFESQKESNEAIERSRVLYAEAYKRVTSIPILSPNAAEHKAIDMFHTSRKSESERIQIWIGDPLLWEILSSELFSNNFPSIALLTFEYAIARGGCRSIECLLELGRCLHRLKKSERAQTILEQALALDYYAYPTRFWLAAVSFPWSQHLKREERGALGFQRVYRGYLGRQLAIAQRHKRAWTWLRKVSSVGRLYFAAKEAQRRVAIRKALEQARELSEREAMHNEDWFLVYLKWNAAARKIQSLVPLHKAKKELRRRKQWMEQHKALLRRVVSNSNSRLVQTCFASMVEFVDIVQQEKYEAIIRIQRVAHRWLWCRHLDKLQTKRKTQQSLVDSFLGKTKSRWKHDCFMALRDHLKQMKQHRNASAMQIQCCYRSYFARKEFRSRMAHQVRVRSFMLRLFSSRNELAMRQTFNAIATMALTAKLYKNKSATRIQKIARGRQGRATARRVRKRHLHCEMLVKNALATRMSKIVDLTWTQWQLYVQWSQAEKLNAAILIQKLERGRRARQEARHRREYLHIYFDRTLTYELSSRRAFFGALRYARRFRSEREDHAARVLQRTFRHIRNHKRAKTMRIKLKKKQQVAHIFQTTFHATAAAFFKVLRAMREVTKGKLNGAARIIQRNLRGWLARRVFARMAKQHRQATYLLDRVINREKRHWCSLVLRLWKEGVKACHEDKHEACTRIQRRFRARQAKKKARTQMEKRAKQRRLLDGAMTKPIARCFNQWANQVLDRHTTAFRAAILSKQSYHRKFEEQILSSRLERQESHRSVSSMLFFHVLTRTRQTGLCQLPLHHGFNLLELRQLFQLATSVIADAGVHSKSPTTSDVVEALALMTTCPVQKLILYNESQIDLLKLTSPHLHLTSLVVGGTSLSARQLMALSIYLAQPASTLQQLVLESCNIGNGGAVVLALGLAQNASVWKVDLSRNHIGDAACRAWSEMLIQNETLQIVGLNYNDLSDNAILGYMEPALMSLPTASSLESLQLQSNTRLTIRGIDALEAAVNAVNASKRNKTLRLEVTRHLI